MSCEADRGGLQVGKRADLAVHDLDRPGLRPVLDGRLSTVRDVVAFAATSADVIETIIGGEVAHRRGGDPMVGVDAVQQVADRVWRSAGGDCTRSWL